MRSVRYAAAGKASASLASASVSSCLRSRQPPRPVTAALSMPVAPGSSSLLRAPERSASESRPHVGRRRQRGKRRFSLRAAAAEDNDNAATSASSTSTTVVAVISDDPLPPPPPLPSLFLDATASLPVSNRVGTTALDASALPALDAAVSLPVDPSSSSSGLLAAEAASNAFLPPASSSSSSTSSSPFPLFEIPPAVLGMLAINLGAALFGSNMVAVKLAQSGGASPAALSAGRFALAAAVFLPSAFSALRKERREKYSSSLTKSGVELGLYLFGGYTGQAVGLSMTTASKGAFASAFTVLAVPMLQAAAAALRSSDGGDGGPKSSSSSSPPASTWIAAAAAVVGVFLLTSDGGPPSGGNVVGAGGGELVVAVLSTATAFTATTKAAGPNLGDLLCVLSAVLFGVHKWRSEQLVEKLSTTAAATAVATTEEKNESTSNSTSNEETVRSLVALQLCVLALASIALCVPEAAGAVRDALAEQRSASSVFYLAASSSPSSVEFYGAVAKQLWSEFAGLPWALFAYMGLFT